MMNSFGYRLFVLVLSQLLLIQFSIEPAAAATSKTGRVAVEKMLKTAPLHKKSMTVKEFYQSFSGQLTPEYKKVFDPYMEILKNEKAPKVTVSEYQDSDGKGTRLYVEFPNKQVATVDLYLDQDRYMKVNNTVITTQEMKEAGPAFDKIKAALKVEVKPAKQTLAFPTLEVWNKMSAKQRQEYILKLREFYDSLEAVQALKSQSDTAQIWRLILGESLYASDGWDCIVAGYPSTTKGGSCGGGGQMKSQFEACGKNQRGSIQCNPLIFGNSETGGPLCVTMSNTVSSTCHNQSPINDGGERLLRTLMKDKSFSLEGGKVKPEDWKKVDEHMQGMKAALEKLWQNPCGFSPPSPAPTATPNSRLPENQKKACVAIRDRFFKLDQLVRQQVAPSQDAVKCDADRGMIPNSDEKTSKEKLCMCNPKTHKEDSSSKEVKCISLSEVVSVAPTPPAQPAPPVKPEQVKDDLNPWLMFGLGALAGLGLACLFKAFGMCDKDEKNITNNYSTVNNTTNPVTVIYPPYHPRPRGGEGAHSGNSSRPGATQ